MLTQEEYMDVLGMRSQGWTIAEIARETNYHPATVSKWLKEGGPPPARTTDPALLVVDQRWGSRIAELIELPLRLLWQTTKRCSLAPSRTRTSSTSRLPAAV